MNKCDIFINHEDESMEYLGSVSQLLIQILISIDFLFDFCVSIKVFFLIDESIDNNAISK